MDYQKDDISLVARLLREGTPARDALLNVNRGTVYVIFERDDVQSSSRLYDVCLRGPQATDKARRLSANGKSYNMHDARVLYVDHDRPIGTRSGTRLRFEDKGRFFELAAQRILEWDERYKRQEQKAKEKMA
jgi:hypothetical protein